MLIKKELQLSFLKIQKEYDFLKVMVARVIVITFMGFHIILLLLLLFNSGLSQSSLRTTAANTHTVTTPEDVSHSRGRNVEGKEF